MTNDDKAREISSIYQDYIPDYNDVVQACLEMAEWKEQEMIEKAVEMFHKDSRWDYIFGVYPELINDFKKYMEEN